MIIEGKQLFGASAPCVNWSISCHVKFFFLAAVTPSVCLFSMMGSFSVISSNIFFSNSVKFLHRIPFALIMIN
jgi:hypothetical protein